jgi:hypothetical protein
MAKPKRTPLSFNTNELTNELKESSGKGVDAFFSSPSFVPLQTQSEPAPLSKHEILTKESPISNAPIAEEKRNETASTKDEKKRSRPDDITRNITILHLDETDITRLREATDRVQTYRLTRHEIEWMKDTAYRLSKELKRGKVAQADILRIAILLFENYLAMNKGELIEILEKMK